MKCANCGSVESRVIDSRASEDGQSIRRRRECGSCGRRFTTYETIEINPVYVIKKDQRRELYNEPKLKRGILKACEKRPVSIAAIEVLAAGITKTVTGKLELEVTTDFIGELVMEGLKKLDDVAYVRYAAVHREFKDINSWLSEITNVISSKNKL